MQRIERMDDKRRQRIEDLIRDVEGVTADFFDESTSRSIKDLIGKLRLLVQNLSDAGPVLDFFRPRFGLWNWQRKRRMHLTAIAFCDHRKDIVALHDDDNEGIRRPYGRTERRRRMEVFSRTANQPIEGNTR